MYIYKITNKTNGKVYIGQTVRKPEKRWKEHINLSNKRKNPFYLSIKKYGVDCFSFEVLEVCGSLEELNKKEETYIAELNTLHPFGYNLKMGGDNKRYSELSKKKISLSHSGKIMTEGWRQKISNAIKKQNQENKDLLEKRMSGLKKLHQSEEFSVKCSKKSKERWANESFRKKMSEIKKGVLKTEDHKKAMKQGMRLAHAKPFNVYKLIKNEEPVYVGSWDNQVSCSESLKVSQNKISLVLSGQRKSHKGYFFKYKD